MRKILKGAGYAAGAVVVVVMVAAAVVYVASERILRQVHDTPLSDFALAGFPVANPVANPVGSPAGQVSTDAARGSATGNTAGPGDAVGTESGASPDDVAEGRRRAAILGCFGGCHGTSLEGRIFVDEPMLARIAAPNLTRAVREHTDAELERLIRRGVRKDGRSVFAMPSPMFSHLADEDYARVVAFLRSQSEVEGQSAMFRVGPMGRLGIVTGQFPPLATLVEPSSPAVVPRHDPLEWGRYLAQTSCSECHGADLRGSGEFSPDLRIAAAFQEEDWFALLRTGRGLGGRELGLMAEVAGSRFQHFTDDEVRALRVFLATLAD